jgi:hypothetical protein
MKTGNLKKLARDQILWVQFSTLSHTENQQKATNICLCQCWAEERKETVKCLIGGASRSKNIGQMTFFYKQQLGQKCGRARMFIFT